MNRGCASPLMRRLLVTASRPGDALAVAAMLAMPV